MSIHDRFRARCGIAVAVALLFFAGLATAQPGMVRFSFESGDLGGWRVVDGAFGALVCGRDALHHTGEPYVKHGKYFLSTLDSPKGQPDDKYTGEVESPVFTPTSPDMSLLVGGGNHDDTFVALCAVDGTELARTQGENGQVMKRVQWNVPAAVGQPVFLRAVDRNTGAWGHLTFDDFIAQGRVDEKATKQRDTEREQRRVVLALRERLDVARPEALQAAIEDLTATFPEQYTRGRAYLDELAGIREKIDSIMARAARGKMPSSKDVNEQVVRMDALRRTALLANPLLKAQPLLYVARKQYKPDHHNTETMFQTGEINTASFEGGGALKALDVATGETRTILETKDGLIRDPEVHFDGRRIIFSMRKNIEDDYHIYEINIDGSGLRQLTSAPGVTDIDPLYLPDDHIAFSSSREPKYCMCNRHIMCNMFRMEPDGANIHQIGKSTLFEGHGTLLPDGRILYDRWEYVDRNFGDAQGLWTVFPDGTGHALYWGNNTWSPGGAIDARPVPGTDLVACIFGSCHDRPWGALAVIDRAKAMDGADAVVHIWPRSALELTKRAPNQEYGFDNFLGVRLKYEDPYPLNDTYFLCSRMTGQGERMGIYLVDTFGNEIEVHTDGPGCFDPMPLGPRSRPPASPTRRDYENGDGLFYVADVYEGTHMVGVERGAVKYLRVVESPEKRFWTHPCWGGQGVHCPAMNWHDFCNKRILGTVPVEEDGSAYFAVPSDRFVFFQLLDAKGMMVQSMRSGTIIQSGERQGCVGCHEDRRTGPLDFGDRTPLALRREPSRLDGWHGEPRLFSFMAEVQPVFDRHCVKCHDYGEDAGAKLNLAGDRGITFNTSYAELWRKQGIKAVGAGPAEIQQPRSWGSHVSPIIEVILKGHKDVFVDADDLDRLITWVDINAPYYPTYASAYPDNLTGRSPLDPAQIARLTELTGVKFEDLASFNANKGPEIAFDRPELSPCLADLKEKGGAEYEEALAIIQAGKAMLEQQPRADMPGFVMNPTDAAREKKYQDRAAIEAANRQAIREGRKVYDPGL